MDKKKSEEHPLIIKLLLPYGYYISIILIIIIGGLDISKYWHIRVCDPVS